MQDRVLKLAGGLLTFIFWLNIACAIGFAGFLLFSAGFGDLLLDRIGRKYGPTVDAGTVVWAMRLVFALGLVAVAVAWRIIRELQAIIATVAAGDPFVASNARRLQAIGWALLGWQVIDLAFGAIVTGMTRLGVDAAGWTPSLAGWVVTLLVFVLARVFAAGTRMRDELEGTV